jgi:spore maturation protein CgeB
VVIAHEWNPPTLIAALGRRRSQGHFVLLFHDTHHRAVSSPDDIDHFDLTGFDAVLAFGEVLRDLYLTRGWGRRAFTWHEAADTALFRPAPGTAKRDDVIFIGNWGDGERDAELRRFLIDPVANLGLTARIHGVRYPDGIRQELAARRISYAGWLPNHHVPAALARARMTVHVPRRPYAEALPGIPTIRVFEALACGIPLISSPCHDTEGLVGPGHYLTVSGGKEMETAMRLVREDHDLAAAMTATGLASIRDRHSCAHRVGELLAIVGRLGAPILAPPRPAPDLEPRAFSS